MSFKLNALVVASSTADSEELMRALAARAERRSTAFTLLVPTPGPGSAARSEAAGRLERALERARAAGLEIDGMIGDSDPIVAVSEAYDPRRFDEIIVSTLPKHASHWMRIELPHRVARATGARVIHVQTGVAHPAHAMLLPYGPGAPRRGVLAALTPLTWARRRSEQRNASAAQRGEPRVG